MAAFTPAAVDLGFTLGVDNTFNPLNATVAFSKLNAVTPQFRATFSGREVTAHYTAPAPTFTAQTTANVGGPHVAPLVIKPFFTPTYLMGPVGFTLPPTGLTATLPVQAAPQFVGLGTLKPSFNPFGPVVVNAQMMVGAAQFYTGTLLPLAEFSQSTAVTPNFSGSTFAPLVEMASLYPITPTFTHS